MSGIVCLFSNVLALCSLEETQPDKTMKFRVVCINPRSTSESLAEVCEREQLDRIGDRYFDLPALAAVVDDQGLPIESATLFLANHSIRSRGATGSTVRTYAECLACWFSYLASNSLTYLDATEEDLQIYRVTLCEAVNQRTRRKLATATANLRVVVAAEFHKWCQHNRISTALGQFLVDRTRRDRAIRLRIIKRHPRSLSMSILTSLFQVARDPYKLIFRWALVTGMRRFEILNLRVGDLPKPEELARQEDGIARIDILRKGGKLATVYVPVLLVEDTQWFILTKNPFASPDSFVFVGDSGRQLSLQSTTKEFSRCAKSIGISATLHHLRHTFATHVLANISDGDGRNSLKIVQVLLSHSSCKTTEIYCEALDVMNPEVVDALGYLYGASL